MKIGSYSPLRTLEQKIMQFTRMIQPIYLYFPAKVLRLFILKVLE